MGLADEDEDVEENAEAGTSTVIVCPDIFFTTSYVV